MGSPNYPRTQNELPRRSPRYGDAQGHRVRPSGDATGSRQEQPLVEPQVSHFRQVPLRTIVKFEHSEQLSPV